MKSSLRTACRMTHGFAAIYNLAYVYSPLHGWEYGFMTVQYITMPMLALTGIILVRARKQAGQQRSLG